MEGKPGRIWLERWPCFLKIYTLGRFEILKDGKPVSFPVKIQQKPLAMLKALLAFGGMEVEAETLSVKKSTRSTPWFAPSVKGR